MPLYRFHVQDRIQDQNGSLHVNLYAARQRGIQEIRRLLGEGSIKGEDRSHWVMTIADETGRIVLSLPFWVAISPE